MSYNQTSNELSIVNKKTTFRNYMKTQIRYVKLLSYILNEKPEFIIEKKANRFRDLYTTKHGIYINN